MSTYYGFYCNDHRRYSELEYRNDDEPLQFMYALRKELLKIQSTPIDIEIRWGYPSDGGKDLDFLMEHIDCPIDIRDGYDNVIPFDEKLSIYEET